MLNCGDHHLIPARAAVWRFPRKPRRIVAEAEFSAAHAALCSPCRKFSINRSEVRREKVRMLMVVVLSVQFKNTLASQTYKFGTSCVCPNRLVTKCFGSVPMRHVPVSCKLYPGISGAPPLPSTTPPAARSNSAHACFECSHIFSTFSSH